MRRYPASSGSRGLLRRGQAFSAIFYLTAGTFVLSIMFGGGTHSGFFGDVFLQLVSLPLLWMAVVKLIGAHGRSHLRWIFAFVAAVVVLPLVQLAPLPSSIWSLLPGRGIVTETFSLLGLTPPPLPLTLSPTATWLCFLGLLPPIAIFLGVVMLDYAERQLLSLVLLTMGVLSAFLGLMQLAGGTNNALRFYAVTNATEAVGFFANRNHFAALLYSAMLFCLCWLDHAATPLFERPRYAITDFRTLVRFAGCAIALGVLLVGELMARSRAGLVLSAAALCVGVGIGSRDRGARVGVRSNQLLLAAVGVTIVFCLQFAFYRILDRLDSDTFSETRLGIVRTTISAVKAYMPLGSGLGTFVPVYQLFEKPAEIGVTYVNHAHNDLLELGLEAGVPGLALVTIYVVWLGCRMSRLWRESRPAHVSHLDYHLMRAASCALVLLLIHSIVDYPLRTSTLMAVAAFASGLLILPLGRSTESTFGDAGPAGSSALE